VARQRPRISTANIQPKFTTEDFVAGIRDFENRMADSFFFYLQDQFKKKQLSFEAIEKVHAAPGEVVDESKLFDSVKRSNNLVFIQDGKAIGELSYSDVFKILDRGQHDLGILPQPILKTAFDDFRPVYKLALKNFLLGKK
jgi:hypothetical protein